LLLLFIFSLPFVQTKLGKIATDALNKKYNTHINITGVGLKYNGDISLKNVLINDHHQDTLFHVGQINASILDFKRLKEGDLLFSAIELEGLDFKMIRYKNEGDSNLDIFVASFDSKKPKKTVSTFLMKVADVAIKNSRFRYIDQDLSTPKVLDFTNLNIEGDALKIEGPNVYVDVTDANMLDFRGAQITQLQTQFNYSLTQMNFKKLRLKTSKSDIKGALTFNYQRSDFKDFNNLVKIEADFNNSKIAFNDLNHFYDEFGTDVATFSTKVSGTLNQLELPNLKLKTLRNTVADGNFKFENIFSKKDNSFKFTGNYKQLTSNYYDLKKMLPNLLGRTLPSSFRNLGTFTVKGKSVITQENIDANVVINTQIGNLKSNLSLSNIDDIDNAKYVGPIQFTNFDLGKLLEDNTFGKVTFDGYVNGKGFTLNNVNTLAKGAVSSIEINKYTYQNLDVFGVIKHKVFKGKLTANDPNLKLNFDGLVDMSSKIDKYDFTASVAYADFNKINLFKRDSISKFKGNISMKMNGSNIDDAFGEILFTNTTYTNQNEKFSFKDFKLSSQFDENRVRTIIINSPEVVNAKITGKFKFKEAITLSRNALGSIYTNFKPLKVSENQFFKYHINIENKLTEIFYPDIIIRKKAILKGRVSSNEKDFKLTLKSPEIIFKGNTFANVDVKMDNSNPFYNTYVNIKNVETDIYNVSEFNLINRTISDTLFFRTEFKGGKFKKDQYNLNLYHTINTEGKSVFGVKKSDLKINDYDWFINENEARTSKVVFDSDFNNIKIHEFIISHGNEFLKLSGAVNGTQEKQINVALKDLNLAKFLPVMKTLDVKGVVNGKIDFNQTKGDYKPIANFEITNFEVNNNKYGTLKLSVLGNKKLNKVEINSSIENENVKALIANGTIDFAPKKPKLNLGVTLNQFDASAFSNLGKDVITNIRGLISGNAIVFGDYNNPDFSGNLFLDEAGLKIPYLNVDFDFENGGRVRLNKKQFIFDNIAILDTKEYTSGRIKGFIAHNAFTDWELGLEISSPNLLVLDKKQEENSLYFGKVFIDGKASLTGPTDELLIKVEATSNKGTIFKIPITDSEAVGDNTFIRLATPESRGKVNAINANLPDDISGLELAFDLNVTPDAEIEIVLDQETGSVLRGSGAGLLRIDINTNGKFNMYGDFIVSNGTYNFVYGSNFLQGGFIEKKFKVKPGGTINWDGNPYQARLNINAAYRTNANPAILLDNPSINRKIPVDVIINLNGALLQPDVNFNIEFPNTNSVVKSELLYKLDDKEFRDKQALSLVTSGQFTNAFAIGQAAFTGNLVERATSLVNNIFSEEDDKFKVGLNYEQGETNPYLADLRTEDRVGFTVSTQITERILINGKVGIPVGGVSKTVVAGDVQVEFLLNKEGTLRAKIFNRENDFQITGLTNEVGYTQGVGVSYQVDFDTFEELIQKIFSQKKKKKQPEKKEDDGQGFIRRKIKTKKNSNESN